jgi:hypothetical protein
LNFGYDAENKDFRDIAAVPKATPTPDANELADASADDLSKDAAAVTELAMEDDAVWVIYLHWYALFKTFFLFLLYIGHTILSKRKTYRSEPRRSYV